MGICLAAYIEVIDAFNFTTKKVLSVKVRTFPLSKTFGFINPSIKVIITFLEDAGNSIQLEK